MQLSKALKGYRMARTAEGISPNTLAIYDLMFAHLVERLEDKDIREITIDDLRAFLTWLREDYRKANGDPVSGSYHRGAWKAIRSFYTWAEEEFEIRRPDLKLKQPKYSPKLVQPFSPSELQAMLNACQYSRTFVVPGKTPFQTTNRGHRRNIAILLLLLDSGLRVSEVTRLNVGDVQLESGEMTVVPYGSGKKSRPRHVYLGEHARSALWRYLEERGEARAEEPLFVSENQGNRLTRFTMRNILRGIAERAGVDNVHPHRFRHTFAIEYLRNGGDIFTLKRLLGHATFTMVNNYLNLSNTDTQEAHRRASPADRLFDK